MTTVRWSSRAGFLLATVGAAVGLGNVWRFSAVVGGNGGGAYLIPYLLAAVTCAVPRSSNSPSAGSSAPTSSRRFEAWRRATPRLAGSSSVASC